MTEKKNRRKHERIVYETSKLMYKRDSKDDYNYGVMTNYSPGGMYLKTSEYMDIGQAVIIRMEDYDGKVSGPEKNDYYYGQIRWIRNFHTKPYDSSYGYGIEFDREMSF